MIHTNRKKDPVAGKAAIRIIKKGEKRSVAKPLSANKQPKKEVARQLAATVMNWISDLQARKLEETRLAVERFQHL